MKRVAAFSGFALLIIALVIAVVPTTAHEGREVGEYVLVIGWRVEPTYTDLFNGPELTVHREADDEPVEALEETLSIEVSLGPATKMLQLRAVAGEPGHYIADLIPTRAGDYTFRVIGTIGDVNIDESFSSTDGDFSTVSPLSDIQFP